MTWGRASKKKLILINTGLNMSFLSEAQLVYKAGAATRYYQGHTNSTNFETWIN
jgi:hypothetical protein